MSCGRQLGRGAPVVLTYVVLAGEKREGCAFALWSVLDQLKEMCGVTQMTCLYFNQLPEGTFSREAPWDFPTQSNGLGCFNLNIFVTLLSEDLRRPVTHSFQNLYPWHVVSL